MAIGTRLVADAREPDCCVPGLLGEPGAAATTRCRDVTQRADEGSYRVDGMVKPCEYVLDTGWAASFAFWMGSSVARRMLPRLTTAPKSCFCGGTRREAARRLLEWCVDGREAEAAALEGG